MGYFQIGLITGILLFIISPYLILKNRWFSNDLLEGLYDWWDGEDLEQVDLSGTVLVSVVILLISIINIFLWVLILPLLLCVWFINSIRNRKLNKNN